MGICSRIIRPWIENSIKIAWIRQWIWDLDRLLFHFQVTPFTFGTCCGLILNPLSLHLLIIFLALFRFFHVNPIRFRSSLQRIWIFPSYGNNLWTLLPIEFVESDIFFFTFKFILINHAMKMILSLSILEERTLLLCLIQDLLSITGETECFFSLQCS